MRVSRFCARSAAARSPSRRRSRAERGSTTRTRASRLEHRVAVDRDDEVDVVVEQCVTARCSASRLPAVLRELVHDIGSSAASWQRRILRRRWSSRRRSRSPACGPRRHRPSDRLLHELGGLVEARDDARRSSRAVVRVDARLHVVDEEEREQVQRVGDEQEQVADVKLHPEADARRRTATGRATRTEQDEVGRRRSPPEPARCASPLSCRARRMGGRTRARPERART